MKSVYAIPFALAALLMTATATAQAAPAPQGHAMMQGNCDQMMSSGGMMVGMTIGWILTALLGIAAIFALYALGLYMLRRSRQFLPPSDERHRPLRDEHASAPT